MAATLTSTLVFGTSYGRPFHSERCFKARTPGSFVKSSRKSLKLSTQRAVFNYLQLNCEGFQQHLLTRGIPKNNLAVFSKKAAERGFCEVESPEGRETSFVAHLELEGKSVQCAIKYAKPRSQGTPLSRSTSPLHTTVSTG